VIRAVARVLRPFCLFAFSDWITQGELSAEERSSQARIWSVPALLRVSEYVRRLDESGFDVLLAEDRTPAVAARPQSEAPDQQEWERVFAARYGVAEIECQREPGRVWRALVQARRTGHALFVARRSAEA
jgi:hypothetical protein